MQKLSVGKYLLSLLTPLLPAFAMSAAAVPGAEQAPDTVMLQEVNVTAIKQGQNLSGNPVAFTSFSRTELERRDITTIKSLSDMVPNLYIPDYGSRITSSIYVRGLGARMDQPVVGLNVDNVPVMNKDAYDFDVEDISSVNVIRGPQSALYGRNTMCGVINITTLSPLDYQGFRGVVKAGNGGLWRGNLSWYHRLKPNMGLSLSAGYLSTKGFFTNEYNGKKLDHERQWSGRAKFEWRIKPNLQLNNVLSLSDLHQGGYPYESVTSGRIETNDTCFYKRFLISDGLTINWKHDRFTLSSVTSLQHINDNMTLDQDFLPVDYFTLTQKKQETSFTQDFLMKGAVGERYHWLTGLFGFYKHLDMQAPVTFYDYGIDQLIESHVNSVNPSYPIYWDKRYFTLNSDFTMPTYGLALYHQSKLEHDRWDFTLGLRLDFEHASLDYHSFCNTSYTIYHPYPEPFRHVPLDIDQTGHLSKGFLQLLPQLGAVYRLDDNGNNLYANISKGYKAGGFNTQMFSDVLQQTLMRKMGLAAAYKVEDVVEYKPEQSWNAEIGTHFNLPTLNLSGSAALFFIYCRDQQLTMFPEGTTTGRIMTNAGKTRSFGGELSISWRPLTNLLVDCSYGYTNAKFIRFNNGLGNYHGNYLPYAPVNTIGASVAYGFDVSSDWLQRVEFNANWRGTGRIYWNEANSLSQNLYSLLGASVTFHSKNCSLQFWGENLTDTKYCTFYFVSIGNEFLQRGRPLKFGATLRVNI